ncbi:hypothetical protein GJAV_G00197820 [Gymnothorax javanicus]|nr:hypothetical protein GJAV_G00197820 [Gymnothorax javanicus]
MRKDFSFLMFLFTFLKTVGSCTGRISVSQKLKDRTLTITCSLLSEDSVTQINWEMVSGQNRSIMGIVHPQFGTHIPPGVRGTVEIENSSFYHSTSLKLTGIDMSNDTKHCCLFITFPSGNLEACADLLSIETAVTESPESKTHIQPITDGWWTAVAAIAVVSILALIASHYLYKRYCSRRQVFRVEQACLTEPQATSNESMRELSQSSPQKESSEKFDPSKLYAKIKDDFHYGRLWKCYQSNTRAWTKAPQPKIYHLLGEQPPQQKDNREPEQD